MEMISVELQSNAFEKAQFSGAGSSDRVIQRPHKRVAVDSASDAPDAESFSARRRTPRRSLVVILPDDHVVSPSAVAGRLATPANGDENDVIVACAGRPRNLDALCREVPDLQVLLAPSGTSTEDLRALAMTKAPGDIVTLVCGSPAAIMADADATVA